MLLSETHTDVFIIEPKNLSFCLSFWVFKLMMSHSSCKYTAPRFYANIDSCFAITNNGKHDKFRAADLPKNRKLV